MANKVLIVEDEVLIGMMLAAELAERGYQVLDIAASGEDALRSINRQRPDVVILDISLPGGLDGVETARLLRERIAVPVIFFTGYQDEQLLRRAREVFPVAIVNKLDAPEHLQRALDLALQDSTSRQ